MGSTIQQREIQKDVSSESLIFKISTVSSTNSDDSQIKSSDIENAAI